MVYCFQKQDKMNSASTLKYKQSNFVLLGFCECQFANACLMCIEVFCCQIVILDDLSKSAAAPFIHTEAVSSMRQLVEIGRFSSIFLWEAEMAWEDVLSGCNPWTTRALMQFQRQEKVWTLCPNHFSATVGDQTLAPERKAQEHVLENSVWVIVSQASEIPFLNTCFDFTCNKIKSTSLESFFS